jgi:hypothetical protein
MTGLGEMLNNIAALSPEAFHRYAFAGEALAGKIPPAERLSMAEKASSCGVAYARSLAERYKNPSPAGLCARLGTRLERTEEETNPFLPVFAQFTPPKTITIFSRYSRKAQELADEAAFESRVEDTLIAHELFHLLEEQNRRNIYTRTEKVELWKKPFSNRSRVPCLSEIAAMAFAGKLLGLPYSPCVLNLVLMYSIDPGAADLLYRELLEAGLRPVR